MSCIAGILNLDGAPVDRELLERMTAAMKDRAPDESNVWISGNVGFGHALLRISPESENEHQPRALDGQIWITADARIDGRAELTGKLRAAGEQVGNDAPDAELILHTYHAFGESFLDHLIGDFAFALWDERSRKLICARDHFGVRPFFYARTDSLFLFASDIDSLLQHPAVSKRLDEEAVADFLLFGAYQEKESSIYKDIRRLPPASFFKLTQGGFAGKTYWEPPLHNEVRYKRTSEYVDHFGEIFGQSVNDRIRTNTLALELSGGMDSTSIAAVAAAGRKTAGCSITAYTTSCTALLPGDQEGYYAGLVASYLGVPLVYQQCENYGLFERIDDKRLSTCEPVAHPDLAAHYDKYAQIGETGARVLLTGQGGDAVFNGSATYYSYLLRSGRLLKFLLEAYRHVRSTGSPAGMGLRSALLGTAEQDAWRPPLPDWIEADFARRVDLENRWKSGWEILNGVSDAYHQLQRPWLSQTFEAYEALKMPLQARHPFFDVRLVIFLLGLPNFTKNSKRTMRGAMRGRLPEAILNRPKTTLAGDQIRAKFIKQGAETATSSRLLSAGGGYVAPGQYFKALENYLGGKGMESTWSSVHMISPLALSIWLGDRTSPTFLK